MTISVLALSLLKQKRFIRKERREWENVRNFVCYYGIGKIEKMSKFDVAILESRNLTRQNIEALNRSGTWTIGYISVGEDITLRVGDGKGPGGYASFYFDRDKDGQPDMNPNWNSFFTDAGNPLWQDIIIEKVRTIIEDKGLDGIFLDTVDTVDLYRESKLGMIDLIRRMREEFPYIKNVQNRGFSILEDTAEFIDGLMFEGFSTTHSWEDGTNIRADKSKLISTGMLAIKINELRKKNNFIVFALDYADLDQTELI